MELQRIGLWNAEGELRAIKLGPGLNILTGESQTGKSALIEIIRFCLGSRELRVPAGPIADTVAYYGLIVRIGTTFVFLGRPAVEPGQQTSTEAQLEIGLEDFPDADQLAPNTNVESVRDYLGRLVGIEENRFDPPEGSTRRPLVAGLSHALIHCFQRQDEIASRQILFHNQADPFVAQAIRDTLPYFLGVTGPEQVRKAAKLRDLRRTLTQLQRNLQLAEQTLETGLGEARALLSQAADAGLVESAAPPDSLESALARLKVVRDASPPPAPKQPAGEEFDRLQAERRTFAEALRTLREQAALAAALQQSAAAASAESVEQLVRLQPIGVLPRPDDPSRCPLCDSALENAPPAVEELQAALDVLESQIAAVDRDRPGLEAIQAELMMRQRAVRNQLAENAAALEKLAESADAVEAHQQQLNLGAWVRGRIEQYLEGALVASDDKLEALRAEDTRLRAQITELVDELDPGRVQDAATSVLIRIGRRMTEMANRLDLEHADAGVRVDLSRLTVVADALPPVYMNTGIGSAKNWVGYHLATVLGLQEHFVKERRPVPRFVVLDQPTQAFFPAEHSQAEVTDQDRSDALSQFELMRDVVGGLDDQLQILVLEHADFDEDWFQAAIVERWRDGEALIPAEWLEDSAAHDDADSGVQDEGAEAE